MPLFWKHYKSEATAFIEELKAKKPSLEDEQRQGRALLWERSVTPDMQSEYDDGRVKQQPYVYQTSTSQKP
ncbi:MAG: acetyl-CoA carboxyl transferase [Rhizobacter sp.]|nr:acetyl-CoA carboxyl transferase [Rhizobacter sp.]